MGQLHEADLGDGNQRKAQHYLARQSYFPVLGTCWESLTGTFARLSIKGALRQYDGFIKEAITFARGSKMVH